MTFQWQARGASSTNVNDDLPSGWQQAYDPKIGTYYVNLADNSTQLDDPRLERRVQQEQMLHEYLSHAAKDVERKEEMQRVKQQRLELAEDEMRMMDERLANMKSSTTSLNSTVSTASIRYDPDLLRSEVMMARERVMRLRGEMEHVASEVANKQRGLATLAQVEQRMSGDERHVYGVNEAKVILGKVRELRQSLHSGEHERRRLIERLLRLKNESQVYTTDNGVTDGGLTGLLPADKLSTNPIADGERQLRDSQRWGEICRMKLQYNEARKQVHDLQQQLANIEQHIRPEQIESDRDRLTILQDKEQLLRELKSLSLQSRPQQDHYDLSEQIRQLEYDLVQSMRASNENIERRLRLNEEKQEILHKLAQVTRLTTELELHLKSLSSGVSLSSNSNQGSQESLFSSSSSCSLAHSDYYVSQRVAYSQSDANLLNLHHRLQAVLLPPSASASMPAVHATADRTLPPLADYTHPSMQYALPAEYGMEGDNVAASVANYQQVLYGHQQPPADVEQLYSDMQYYSMTATDTGYLVPVHSMNSSSSPGQSTQVAHHQTSTSSVSVGPPPTYQQHIDSQWLRHQHTLSSDPIAIPYSGAEAYSTGLVMYGGEEAGTVGSEDWHLSPITESPAPPPAMPQALFVRSASASVSNESVAGDSGVYEAGLESRGSDADGLSPDIETAQVQVKLRYDSEDAKLYITIEQARNLTALNLPHNSQVYVKASLLPGGMNQSFATHPLTSGNSARFSEVFSLAIVESRLMSQTLQVLIWCICHDHREHCLGCAQVSLSSFNPRLTSLHWYNVLSFHFMQLDSGTVREQSQEDDSRPVHPVQTDQARALGQSGKVDLATRVGASAATGNDGRQDEDSVARLLQASSDMLRKCVTRDKTVKPALVTDHASHVDRGESSDDSTVISSQTSTLTRNQGGCDLGAEPASEEDSFKYRKDTLQATADHEDDEDEDEEESSSDADMPGDATVRLVTRKQASPDVDLHNVTRNMPRRAKTFSPVDKKTADTQAVYRLSRSGSDTSVKCRHNFLRSARERQSYRYKQVPQCVSRCQSLSTLTPLVAPKRTSLDLELDLQAATLRHEQQMHELDALRTLVDCYEAAHEAGEGVLRGLMSSEQFQTQLNSVLRMEEELGEGQGSLSLVDERAARMLHKIQREVEKLHRSRSREPEAETFREKMSVFTKATPAALISAQGQMNSKSRGQGLGDKQVTTVSTESEGAVAILPLTTQGDHATLAAATAGKAGESSTDQGPPSRMNKLSVHTREPLEV